MSEDIKSCHETMSLLEQQRSKFVTAQKYLQAAELVNQISSSRKKLRELQSELAQLQKKESRSQKYKMKKQNKTPNGDKTVSSFFTSTKATQETNKSNATKESHHVNDDKEDVQEVDHMMEQQQSTSDAQDQSHCIQDKEDFQVSPQ